MKHSLTMTTAGRLTYADMQNPLFLHPSDGPTSISVTKLQGASDYRAWKRSFEIQLSSKRKLGFIQGTVTRSITDEIHASQWDTCNDLVISWLHDNVSDNIKQYILFINSAYEIRKHLRKGLCLVMALGNIGLIETFLALKKTR